MTGDVCDQHGRLCQKFEQAREWHLECLSDRTRLWERTDRMKTEFRKSLEGKVNVRLFFWVLGIGASVLVTVFGSIVAQQHAVYARQEAAYQRQMSVNTKVVDSLARIETKFEQHVRHYNSRSKGNSATYGVPTR
jgi:predicted subunit of tRNA(5-methylaminomethyl-2-thiouridylate) methyltransferase